MENGEGIIPKAVNCMLLFPFRNLIMVEDFYHVLG